MRMTNTDPTPSGLETRQPKRPLIPIARKSYIVDLGCGLTWHVSGSGEALPRLDRLASLWRLQAGGNGVRSSLTFTCSDLDSGEHPSTDTLRSEGWKAVDLAYARIWLHPLVEDVICELGQAPNPIADFSITRKSQASAKEKPPPAARPLTAATTGFGMRLTSRIT